MLTYRWGQGRLLQPGLEWGHPVSQVNNTCMCILTDWPLVKCSFNCSSFLSHTLALLLLYTASAAWILIYLNSWVDSSPVTYTHWAPGEPNNANGEEQCVQMNRHQGTKCQIIQRVAIGTCLCKVTRAGTDTEHVFVKVDGTMPTAVGLEQDTSVRSSQETSTPLLHPHSHGRATALKVTHTHLNMSTTTCFFVNGSSKCLLLLEAASPASRSSIYCKRHLGNSSFLPSVLSGWMVFKDKCFMFKGKRKDIQGSWSFARNWCKDQGGELAVIDTQYENGKLTRQRCERIRARALFYRLLPCCRLCGQLPAGPGAPCMDRSVRPLGRESVCLERWAQSSAVHQLEWQRAQQCRWSGEKTPCARKHCSHTGLNLIFIWWEGHFLCSLYIFFSIPTGTLCNNDSQSPGDWQVEWWCLS